MARRTPVTSITGIGDTTAERLATHEDVETVLDLLNQRVRLDEYANGWDIEAAISLGSQQPSSTQVRGVPDSRVPLLTLWVARGGTGRRADGEKVTSPFDPNPPSDLVAVYDSPNVIGIEEQGFDEGIVETRIPDSVTPQAAYVHDDGGATHARSYIITTASDVESIGAEDEETISVRAHHVDILGSILDTEAIPETLSALGIRDERPLVVQGRGSQYLGVVAPLISNRDPVETDLNPDNLTPLV